MDNLHFKVPAEEFTGELTPFLWESIRINAYHVWEDLDFTFYALDNRSGRRVAWNTAHYMSIIYSGVSGVREIKLKFGKTHAER